MPGTYYLSAWVSSFNEWHDVLENIARLELETSDYYGTGRGIEARFGMIFLPFRWVRQTESHPPLQISDSEGIAKDLLKADGVSPYASRRPGVVA